MAVTHQGGGVIDTTSANLVVANRLADGDYTVVISDELQLTAMEAVQVIQRGKRPNHAIYWVQLHPDTGKVHLRGEPTSFRAPAIKNLNLGTPVARLILSNYIDTGVEVDMESFLAHGVRGISKRFESTLTTEDAGDKTLLELLQDWLTTITRHLQTGELVHGLRVDDHLPF